MMANYLGLVILFGNDTWLWVVVNILVGRKVFGQLVKLSFSYLFQCDQYSSWMKHDVTHNLIATDYVVSVFFSWRSITH